MKIYYGLFSKIISLDNLFLAWAEFYKDKKQKLDVKHFEFKLEESIFQLHRDLKNKTYVHGPYFGFYITDPKLRHIHKTTVKDRVLHHAVFQIINPLFDLMFIPTSFSCRIGKGTHRGVLAVEKMLRQESKNYARPCWALKCDIKKFFDSVDHAILSKALFKRIADLEVRWLLNVLVQSYSSEPERESKNCRRGIPIGNLTSQLFANVYMNAFDQFVKNKLNVKHYVRYTDDFVIVSNDKQYLENLLTPIKSFLKSELNLELHPNKVTIRKFSQGIDFLGYTILPHYRLVRTKTHRRIVKKLNMRIAQYRQGAINEATLNQSLQSYLGVFSHANSYDFSQDLKNSYWYKLSQ